MKNSVEEEARVLVVLSMKTIYDDDDRETTFA